jgi:HD domain
MLSADALTPAQPLELARPARRGGRSGVELGGFSRSVRELVLSHHERLDGAGYPDGRRGDELGLETRILTVCDVYDALVSDRVYRKAWTHQRAIGLLREESGSAYDPRCVEALERVLAGSAAVPAAAPTATRRRRIARTIATAAAALALVFATLGAAAAANDSSASSSAAGHHQVHDHGAPAPAHPAHHEPAGQGGGAYYAP